MRHAAKRDANEGEIIEALRNAGWAVTQVSDGGVPDLICSRLRRWVLIEVKDKGGTVTKAQRDFILAHKAPVGVCYTAEQAVWWANVGSLLLFDASPGSLGCPRNDARGREASGQPPTPSESPSEAPAKRARRPAVPG